MIRVFCLLFLCSPLPLFLFQERHSDSIQTFPLLSHLCVFFLSFFFLWFFHLPSLYLTTLYKSLDQIFVLKIFIYFCCIGSQLQHGNPQLWQVGSTSLIRGPMHWAQGVLATGLQRKSQSRFSKIISLVSFLLKYKKPNKNSYTVIIQNVFYKNMERFMNLHVILVQGPFQFQFQYMCCQSEHSVFS